MKYLYFIPSFILIGCAPIQPKHYAPASASFDNGKRNSGVLVDKQNVPKEFSPHWRDRYNSMVGTYGNDPFFKPALVVDQGISPLTDGNFAATQQARTNFFLMNQWRHEGTHAPAKTLLQKATGL